MTFLDYRLEMSTPQVKNVEKGNRLKAARERLGLTQAAMAKELKINRSYLSELESGAREVDDYYVEKADILVSAAEAGVKGREFAIAENPLPYGGADAHKSGMPGSERKRRELHLLFHDMPRERVLAKLNEVLNQTRESPEVKYQTVRDLIDYLEWREKKNGPKNGH